MEENSKTFQSSEEAPFLEKLDNGDTFLIPHIWNKDFLSISSYLKEEFKEKLPCISFSDSLIDNLWGTLIRIVNSLSSTNNNNNNNNKINNEIADVLTEVLKVLRIAVCKNSYSLKLFANCSQYLECISNLFKLLFNEENASNLCTKYFLQLLLNILQNTDNDDDDDDDKKSMRKKICRNVSFDLIYNMFIKNFGFLYETSALIYLLHFDQEIDNIDVINGIFQYYNDPNKSQEYLEFLTIKIIQSSFIWENVHNLSANLRIKILIQLRDNLETDDHVDKIDNLSDKCIKKLINTFVKYSPKIFVIINEEDARINEISCILEILAHLSSEENYLSILISDKNLFISCGALLINVHRLGKIKNNQFAPIQKLNEIQKPNEELKRNPIFGFKADLIRIIGNLCWKNREMQNLAREAELIPVLLDCCNMDAKNPFIIQWVILAIRNLCEKNEKNQKIINGLTQRGVVSSEVLSEFGIVFEADEDGKKLGIIPLHY